MIACNISIDTSFGSGLGLLLGVAALSESVVGTDEAALETDTFRARAFACRGRQSRFLPLSQHTGHSQLFGTSSLTARLFESTPTHFGWAMSKQTVHSIRLEAMPGVGLPAIDNYKLSIKILPSESTVCVNYFKHRKIIYLAAGLMK